MTMTTKELTTFTASTLESRQPTKVGPKYQKISTLSMIESLAQHGWEVMDVQAKTHTKNTKHMVKFTNKELLDSNKTGVSNDIMPQLIMINSFNGESAFKFMVGWYRFICLNGLIVGNSISEYKVTHTGNALKKVTDITDYTLETMATSYKQICEWKNTFISDDKVSDYGNYVYTKVLGVKDTSLLPYNCLPVTMANRAVDKANDLWTLFNCAQENITTGGFYIPSNHTRNGFRLTRPIKSLDKTIKLNRLLWDVTEQYRKEKLLNAEVA